MVEAEQAKSARQRIRDFVRMEVEGRDGFHISDLTDRAIKLLTGDRDFMDAWLEENLRPAVSHEVQQVVANTRRLIVRGDLAATEEFLEERVVKFRSRFTNWREHTGDLGHIRLQKLNADQLRVAAGERLDRGRSETVLGKTWLKLAEGLKGSQVVEDVYTDEAIEQVYESVNGQENEV